MADRYWVGGTANWDGTAGTKWATSSGGLGGASVPTSADDVFFTNLSTGTCTISLGNTGAKSINCTGFTGTLAGGSAITVSGSVTLVAGMTMSYTGTMTLNGTATITSAGKAFGSVTVDGAGITVTLGDAFSVGFNTLTLTQGTFNAANFNVTVGGFSSSNTNTRTLTMGSGTWTVQSNATAWNTATTTGLTLNANTSTISMIATAGKTFAGGGLTYYNLSQAGSGLLLITGSNSFNNLTNTVSAADATVQITAGTTQTFTNFSYSATAPYSAFLISNTTGSTYTISKSSGTVNASRLLIRDSVATGGATWNATSSVSLGNNTGWVITASAGRYWVGGTASWDGTAGTKWATSSGAGGGATVPGLVDPAYFDAASGVSTVTIAAGNLGCAGFICTGFTGTLTGSTALSAYGNVTLVAGMTYTYTGTLSILGPSTVTSAGKTFGPTTVGSSFPTSSHTVTLGDSLTLGTTNTFTLQSGTLNLANFTLNTGIFSSSNSNTRSITFGTGNIALTSTTASTTVLDIATATNLTWTGTGGFTRNQAATATINVGTTAGGSLATSVNLTVNAGSSTLTLNGWYRNLDFTGSTSTVSGTLVRTNGNVTLASGGTYTGITTFQPESSGTFTSNGRSITTLNIFPSGGSNTFTLGGALTCTGTVTLNASTLALANFTLSTPSFNSSNSNTRAITFGTGNIALTSSVAATTVLSMATATGFTWTGTGGFTRNMAATATVSFGVTTGGTVSNAPNLTVNAGSSALTIATGSYFKNLIFTGYSGTPSAIYNAAGNLTLSTGGTYTSVTPTFLASGTVTSVGKTLASVTVNGSGITVTLADAMTLVTNVGTFTLTAGTLDLNGNTLSTGAFSSSNSNARAITFGSANIALITTTASVTVIEMATATNFTWTGTGGFTRNMTGTATVQFGSTAGGTVSNAPNLTVNAGPSALTITQLSWLKNVNFTGSTCSVTGNSPVYVAGNLTLASGGTYTSFNPAFFASGTLTSAGKSLAATSVAGSGITVTLADAANCTDLLLQQGTLNLAGFTFTATTTARTGSSNVKNLTFNGGTLVCSAATTTAWDNAGPTNFTTTAGTGTGTISMTAATAKTFVGGGSTYNCTLNQGGAGTLTISGSNTFNNITNSTQPATVTFTAGTTQTVSAFGLSGTAGNLITINSSTPGSQFTLSDASGVINAQYLAIQDSNATGGAVWNAFLSNGNVDNGNNTGWIFAGSNFFMFFM